MSVKNKNSARVVVSAIIGNFLISVAKLVGWFFTYSPSMLAETIHSFADTTNQALLYVGIRHSNQKPTRRFPMGRGLAQYMWNLISAIGIFFVGFGVTIYHGFHSLITTFDDSKYSISWVAVTVLLLAFLIEGTVFFIALKEVLRKKKGLAFFQFFRVSDDPTLIAVLFEDGIAVLGVFLAGIGMWTSYILQSPIPDAIVSIIIACLLGVMAVILAFTNAKFLIGTAVSASEEQEIREFIEAMPEVEKVTRITTAILGPGIVRLSVELEFHGGILIDPRQISRDADKIRSGEADPLQILVDTSERMVRMLGNKINDIERKLRSHFSKLTVIDVEVN
ncbi:MAG: cation diffusion facilitator family transporter [Bdellovibrionales bacterium]|nr:cation diffusion facilitator family transporter [Bdellovibrionales bacterium]